MYIAGTESCQISVDEPSTLVVALYLREGWQPIELSGEYVGDTISLCFSKELS